MQQKYKKNQNPQFGKNYYRIILTFPDAWFSIPLYENVNS